MAFQNFEDLKVWQRALELCIRVFESLENCKRFGLKDQMERSSLSVPSNIAEGQEKGYPREFVRFLRIAKGSCGELRTQFYVAKRLGVISEEIVNAMITESKEISAMIQGLIRSIETNPVD